MNDVPYIVFDRVTGDVLKTGSCPAKMVATQPGEGQSVMIGEADDRLHRIVRDPDGRPRITVRPDAVDHPVIQRTARAAGLIARGVNPGLAQRAAQKPPGATFRPLTEGRAGTPLQAT